MPTEMFNDANKLCLDELCRVVSFSGGFLGNKDDPLNATLAQSECLFFSVETLKGNETNSLRAARVASVYSAQSDNGVPFQRRGPLWHIQAIRGHLDRDL